jgi:nucleoside triphosphate pyrophosphatase
VPQPTIRFNTRFVLASQSPRRKILLQQLGLSPEVIPSHAPEVVPPGADPIELVQSLATDKAANVGALHPKALVLGADTIVVLDGQILGKPVDEDDARQMLSSLSARSHTVFTGIALVHQETGRSRSTFAETTVTFGGLSSVEIARYVAGGSPMDKAGAYGIQDDAGALFVDQIQGDFYNVVGLPLRTMYLLLEREFSDLLDG